MDLLQKRLWNANHKKLTSIITRPSEHNTAVNLFLINHSLLHSSKMSNSTTTTLEDELFKDLKEVTVREYPVLAPDTRNSIAWHIWHITRIEDMTMNVLVNGAEQIFHLGSWHKKLKVNYVHSGNEMTENEVSDLSTNIDISELLSYRVDVGQKTRDIVSNLQPGDFKRKVEPERLKLLEEQFAVKKESAWLLEYWGRKTVAGLILMPATRHLFLHLNKSVRIKQKIQENKKSQHIEEGADIL
ncbi:DinB family protein [Paenibacillus sp. sptzw28]|uniref:DinB family protein n=1 Tax=Paenibacillus sp. sptzw28 TaxID=715179 RepID=UPI001C6EB2E3|nr:DinB family protein [Paenibacillus sp. sptzw28]QYR19633.1 DinB family protein [Paenibacillus sp. sptzw28]